MSEDAIVVAGVTRNVSLETRYQPGGTWFAQVVVSGDKETLRWLGFERPTQAAAQRDADAMLSAMRSVADGYVTPAPEQSQALTSALMDVERYKALHQTATAGWQRAEEEAREADRALRVMSLRLHDVETALARATAERDEARRALGVRDGGAS